MSGKHTPGPWRAELAEGEWRIMAPMREDGVNGYLGGFIRGGGSGGQHPANARLAAAAPELLEALKAVVSSDMAMREEDEGNVSPVLDAARAAVAKAEGRS